LAQKEPERPSYRLTHAHVETDLDLLEGKLLNQLFTRVSLDERLDLHFEEVEAALHDRELLELLLVRELLLQTLEVLSEKDRNLFFTQLEELVEKLNVLKIVVHF